MNIGRISESARKLYRRFLKLRGEPREIALGFALGLFIGMSPTMGFQMGIAATAAALIKWDKIAAAMGVWITNPISAPFIYSFTFFIGAKIYGTEKVFIPPEEMTLEAAKKILAKSPGIFYSLTIGGIIVGIPVAVTGYFIAYRFVISYQDKVKEKLSRQKRNLQIKKDKIKEKVRDIRSTRRKRKR